MKLRVLILALCMLVPAYVSAEEGQKEGQGVGDKITAASKKASAFGNMVVKKTTQALKRAGGKTAQVVGKAGHKTGEALGKATKKLRD